MKDRDVLELWRPGNRVLAPGELEEVPDQGGDGRHGVELDIVDWGPIGRKNDDFDNAEGLLRPNQTENCGETCPKETLVTLST